MAATTKTSPTYDPRLGEGLSKAEFAYRTLRGRILDGTYTSGFRLVIDALARELGMSQVPVREGIRRLEAAGLVIFERNVGATVAPHGVTQWTDTMQTLAVIEGFATALAAPNMRKSDFKAARQTNRKLEDALAQHDGYAWPRENRRFHEIIVARCGNPYLEAEVTRAWDHLDLIRHAGVTWNASRAVHSISEHNEILRTMEESPGRRDAVERSARRHRERTIRAYLKSTSSSP